MLFIADAAQMTVDELKRRTDYFPVAFFLQALDLLQMIRTVLLKLLPEKMDQR